jgi:AcrR family transcriptional regulator
MAKRGLYAKGVAKREEILETALDVIATHGYSSATVKELAAAVGLSQTGLLHYFGSKENLFIEVLRHRDRADADTFRRQSDPARDLRDFGAVIADIVRRNAQVPGLVQLSMGVTAEAISVDHASHEYIRDRYRQITEVFASIAESYRRDGHDDQDLNTDMIGVLTMALVEGLQTQWLYDPQLDMSAHIRYFWHLLDLAFGAQSSGPDGAERSAPDAEPRVQIAPVSN